MGARAVSIATALTAFFMSEGAPAQEVQVAPRTERRSTAMMVTGMVATGGGVGMMATGIGLFAASGGGCQGTEFNEQPGGNGGDSSSEPPCDEDLALVGNALLPLGLVGTLLGLPFWLYGAEQVPRRVEPTPEPRLALSLGAGGGVVGMWLQF